LFLKKNTENKFENQDPEKEGITDQIMRYDKHTKRVWIHDTTGHIAFCLLTFALMAVLYTQVHWHIYYL